MSIVPVNIEGGFDKERFVRSINLLFDADSTSNLEHFHPTEKTNRLFEAVLGLVRDRSFMVVAPYGSGKSLSAAVLLHLIENRGESELFLRKLLKKDEALSDGVRTFLADRLTNGSIGLVIALHAYSHSCPTGIKDGAVSSFKRLGLEDAAERLEAFSCKSHDDFPVLFALLKELCKENGLDRIAILWDEFGRHLESLVSEGRAEHLIDLQVLAEYCSRSEELPVSLTVLLHQVLSRYSHRLPQTAQGEWAKVEGRFTVLQYVDTSKELYRLVAQVAHSVFRGPNYIPPRPLDEAIRRAADSLLVEGLFQGFSAPELRELLCLAHPIEPVALYLLPRVSARVAQNERTMFTFLYERSEEQAITPASIYDYFSDLMQSDLGIGGTGRAWLEAQSAIQKCKEDELSVSALKTACLLGLGLSGERAQATRNLLEIALQGPMSRSPECSTTIENLINRRLLLYRRHTNSISVWHGTDFDLKGRLEALIDRRQSAFDWVDFLQVHFPPKVWKAPQYYAEFGVKRYFSSSYGSLDFLEDCSELVSLEEEGQNLDGRIFHLLPRNRIEQESLGRGISSVSVSAGNRVLISVPSEGSDVRLAALELACLYELQSDEQLTSQDPMVPAELAEMVNDAQDYLSKLLDRACSPQEKRPCLVLARRGDPTVFSP